MTPVDMTDFGTKTGNCFQACLASILEVPLDEVPHFMTMRGDWFEHFNNWMAERGLFTVEVSLNAEKIISCLSPRQWVIITGRSSRGCDHAVVGRSSDDEANPGFLLIHDPHPSREFFEDREPELVMFMGISSSYVGYISRSMFQETNDAA